MQSTLCDGFHSGRRFLSPRKVSLQHSDYRTDSIVTDHSIRVFIPSRDVPCSNSLEKDDPTSQARSIWTSSLEA